MIEVLLPSGVLGSLFFIFWLIRYPQETYRSMTFKDGDPLHGAGSWLFFVLFIGTIVFIVKYN